jgi:hypothetical protein
VKEVTILTGAYEVKQYNDEIKAGIKANGDDEKNITIELLEASGRTRITILKGYKVYFDKDKTWRECLGFESQVLTEGVHTSEKIGHILPIQKIYVGCDLCRGSKGNRNKPNKGRVLFSFPNSKVFGYPLTIEPRVMRPRELLLKTFDSITLFFFSDDNEPIDFMGSQVTAEIAITQV